VRKALSLAVSHVGTSVPPRSAQWAGFATGIALLAVLWLTPWVAFIPPVHYVHPDQLVYENTLNLMKHGEGYYPAAAQALAHVYHAPASILEVRTPVIFWVWQLTGISWPVAFVVIALCGLLVGYLSWPLAGLPVVSWLLLTARPPSGVADWAWNETWALLPVLVSLLLIRKRRWGWAALAALLAACTRETAVLVLVGGLVGAVAKRETWRPWVVALGGWVAFMIWHAHEVWPYLTHNGFPMGFGGGWRYVLDMAGANIGILAGAVILFVIWRTRWSFDWFFGLPLLMLPLVGFFYYRAYWSWLVLPLAVAMLGTTRSGPLSPPRTGSPNADTLNPPGFEDEVVVLPEAEEREQKLLEGKPS
jgi:hypothetical protein